MSDFKIVERSPANRKAYLQGYADGKRDEREACAKDADRHVADADDLPGGQWTDGWKAAAKSIAYDIRDTNG